MVPDQGAPRVWGLAADTYRRLLPWAHEGRLRAILKTVAAAGAAVGVVAAIISGLGASPGSAFQALVSGALGNKFDFGQTVMITSLLALTGLAAAVPFSARLWNVGGEGQMYFGAFTAAGVALTLPSNLPHWFFAPFTVLASAAAGAAWGLVPGILKASVGANEVITSLMMTFIAILASDYAITSLWPQGASPQTADVPQASTLPNIWSGTLTTAGAPIAVVSVLIAWLLMSRTRLGFEIRAIGLNANASRMNGMRIGRATVLAFMIGGAFAGLAGGINVLGMNGSLVDHFSANFGFLGIAVALVARLSPIWILPSAFFFAVLRVGSNALQVETQLSPTVGEILAGTFVLLLLMFRVIQLRYTEARQ